MTSTAMTSIYNDSTTSSAGQQHSNSNNSNNNNSHSPKHIMTANGKCLCCPYGYHLDLDFVQYCENLKANASSKRNGVIGGDQSSAAVRKRQRKSMEVMLGVELADFSAVWDTVLDLSPEHQYTSTLKKRTQFHLTRLSPPPPTPPPSSAASTTKTPTNEFNFEELEEAVNDFERTLQRSSARKTKSYVRDELDHLMGIKESDVCISSNHHYAHSKKYSNNNSTDNNNYNDDEKLRKSLQNNEDVYGKVTGPPEPPPIPVRTSSKTAPSPPIRNGVVVESQQALALSLSRVRSLEEQIKVIPVLQLQLAKLQDENNELQQRLVQRRKLSRTTGCQTTTIEGSTTTPSPVQSTNFFNLHRVSPVSLQSFNNKLVSEGLSPCGSDTAPTPPPRSSKYYRDVGVLTTSPQVVTRDVGCSFSPRVRSVGCHTELAVKHLDEQLYTQQQLDACIHSTIERLEREAAKVPEKPVTKSIGNQTAKVANSSQICQTELPRTSSVGINVVPEKRTVMLSAKPDVRHVATLAWQETEQPKPCEKCHTPKRSVGVTCSIQEEAEKVGEVAKKSAISLKALDFTTSVTASIEKNKTVGTQCQPTLTENAGVQHQPQTMEKASQHLVIKQIIRGTDTSDLIRTLEQATNTKETESTPTRDASCETNPIYLIESDCSIINIPGVRQTETATNTDVVSKREFSCGTEDTVQVVSSTDNYCDSCKNLIKNLTPDVSSGAEATVIAPQSPVVVSKIPRPTLPSPITPRKFIRQDTYTLPPAEQRIGDEPIPASSTSELFSERPAPTSTGIATKIPASAKTDEDICPAEIVLRRSLERQLQSQLSSENRDSLPSSSNATALTDSDAVTLVPCSATRPKPSPSKEMLAALKVINDSLQKSANGAHLKNANKIVQKEWFRISSTENATAAMVDAYLDSFESFSNNLLRYMVNLIDSNGNTAMHYAVSHCNFDIVSILLDSKVLNVNQTNNSGYTCIMLVSLAKLQAPEHHTVIRKLFSMSDVNIRARKHSQTALMLACSHGNIDMVSLLLENGADLNIQDEDGSTALMCSAEHGFFEIVKLLLSHPDCDSTIQDIDGSTALKISLEAGYRDIGVLLYAHEHMTRNGSLKRRNKKSRTTSQSSTT